MLLGDTSDARPIDFLQPALADPEALRYVGAVSYHSWRGWTDDMLRSWHEAARDVNVPLLIGEGSTDAAAWRDPQIFEEPSFALHEIILYLRILAVSQPRSILQWQLTADYSLLAGGGVFGNDKEPLRPMQRFWNLKQLASTPAGAFLLPSISSSQTVHTVAYGDIARGTYAVHQLASRRGELHHLDQRFRDRSVGHVDDAEVLHCARGGVDANPVDVDPGFDEVT